MIGYKFVKAGPTIHLIQYRNGKIIREGSGLAFWYFARP
jgi:hypothetical protein